MVATGAFAGFACAAHALSWDLAGDWTTTGHNPNGTWSYGQLINDANGAPTFSLLSFITNNANGSEYGYNGTPLIYKPTLVPGITSGQVDLNASDATPEVRWTAPTAMYVNITATVGAATGNSFAEDAVLSYTGISPMGTYNAVANTTTWSISDVLIPKGGLIDIYVPDPNGFPNPNTQTQLHIAYIVPEPSPLLAFGAFGLLLLRRRK